MDYGFLFFLLLLLKNRCAGMANLNAHARVHLFSDVVQKCILAYICAAVMMEKGGHDACVGASVIRMPCMCLHFVVCNFRERAILRTREIMPMLMLVLLSVRA